jgi:hypothetical protein
MISYGTKEATIFLLAWVLITTGPSKGSRTSTQDENRPAALEIHLRDLGYQVPPNCSYPGTGIPRDLSLLNDDYKQKLIFVDDKTLIVYQSHCQSHQDGVSPESRSMEAFFLNPQTGAFISRKTWPTIRRRWMNERWDTQARIVAVQGGFLVHAGNSLVLYSSEREQKAKLPLETGLRWAVTLAPIGRTIHLQRIHDDNQAEGEWRTSDGLTKLRSQHEMAGITSASDEAVVDKLAHCVQLQAVGESPRSLYCADPSHLGFPLFLSDSEILSVYSSGFMVLSAKGDKLWGQEVPKARLSQITSGP